MHKIGAGFHWQLILLRYQLRSALVKLTNLVIAMQELVPYRIFHERKTNNAEHMK